MGEQKKKGDSGIGAHIKWETIEYGRNRIQQVKEITGKTPAYLTKVVDAMQEEYDKPNSITINKPELNYAIIRKIILNLLPNNVNGNRRRRSFYNSLQPGMNRNGGVRMPTMPLRIKKLIRKNPDEISINDVKSLIEYHSELTRKHPNNKLIN
jgi:hypothetical protein